MRSLFTAGSRALLASLLIMLPAAGFACDAIPAGQTLWIRLTSPLSSYTARPGDPVTAVLTEAVECDNQVVLPVGTHVTGVVHSVRKVGWGFIHETAALGVRFDRALPPNGTPVAVSATVLEVENAREQVSKGTIQGIRSSDSPQGRINSRLRHLPTWNPYSDVGLIVFKASFPIFPEPEIYLPAGADLRLKLTQPLPTIPGPNFPQAAQVGDKYTQELEESAQELPRRSTTAALVDADVVNLAFIGSREQMEAAFQQAGWVSSDTFTRHSFMRDFYAFLNNSGYAQAPMRPFLLDGQPSDLNLEKSLNSYARRDHLRIWQWSGAAGSDTVWLSSSTHDTGAALSFKHRQFVHHIAPDIDDERSKIVRDLSAAGCIQAVHLVPRPGMPTFSQNANGDLIRTDGDLAVVELRNCQPVVPELATINAPENFKAGNHVFRYFRRQILTFRSDIWRANIIYGAYDLGRMSFEAMKHKPPTVASEQNKADREALLQRSREHPSELTDYSAQPEPIAFR